MALPIEPSEKDSAGYELKPCAPGDLNPEELKQCIAIIGEGGAVNLNTMGRDLPRSHVIAVASYRGEIVAVGAIKPVRKDYAAGIAVKCKYSFPAETTGFRREGEEWEGARGQLSFWERNGSSKDSES